MDHKWKNFSLHWSGELISRRKWLYKLRMGLCSTFRNYEVHQNRIFPEFPGKIRQKIREKKREKIGNLIPWPAWTNFYYWTFLIISKKLFRPILAESVVLEQIWGHFWNLHSMLNYLLKRKWIHFQGNEIISEKMKKVLHRKVKSFPRKCKFFSYVLKGVKSNS